MSKMIVFGAQNRKKLVRGVDVFTRAVCTTYGPFGRNVTLDRFSGILTTKDGVTVAREIHLSDPIENAAVQMLKQACVQVNDKAGDGTTTTACIAGALITGACQMIAAGFDPIYLAKGMFKAAQEAKSIIYSESFPVESEEDLYGVALVASNGDKDVSRDLAKAIMAVGKNGTVTVEDGRNVETSIEFKDGMEIDRGLASASFLKKNQTKRTFEKPLIACIAGALSTVEDVLDLCEEATRYRAPLVIFCHGVSGKALDTLILNDNSSDFEFVAVRSPGNFEMMDEYLRDIAALTGAYLIDPKKGDTWKTWKGDWFGVLESMEATTKKSTLIGIEGSGEWIQERVNYIRASYQHATTQFDVERLNERIAVLEGGLCVMKIGAYTEAELCEKRARVEDALGAVQGALEEGVVAGAGSTYLYASKMLSERPEDPTEALGWDLVRKALQRPLETLVSNSGENSQNALSKMLDSFGETTHSWCVWDFKEKTPRLLTENDPARIFDSLRVAHAVVDTAVSACATLITAEASICTNPKRKK